MTAPASGMPALEAVKGTGQFAAAHAPSQPGAFTFWVWGDNRGGGSVFGQIVDAAAQAKPEFVLSLGDVIDGEPDGPVEPTCTEEAPDSTACTIEKQLASYASTASAAGVPIYNAPGNHEMISRILDGNGHRVECPDEAMHGLYRDNLASTLYGAFSFGNSRFIALNTDDFPVDCTAEECPVCSPCLVDATPRATDPDSGSTSPYECSFIGDRQLSLLKADLAANKDKTHIFIMMHYPMAGKASNPGARLIDDSSSKLATILEDHQKQYKNVSFVLASHEHEFFNPQDKTNFSTVPTFTAGSDPYYLISGGAGAPLDDPGKDGDFHHYLVFKVDGDSVEVTIEKVGS